MGTTSRIGSFEGDNEQDDSRVAAIAATASIGIHPFTGLSTDFLNQYNEVAMVLDMIADDPSLLDELADWKPQPYVAHFERSRFSGVDLILEAYELSPRVTRARFDALAAELAHLVEDGLSYLRTASQGHLDMGVGFAAAASTLVGEVRAYIEQLDMLIHAGTKRADEDTISRMFSYRA